MPDTANALTPKRKNAGTVLCVSASDSSAGAGMQADIKTVTLCGGYAATALTGVSAQNSQGITALYPLAATAVTQQMQAAMILKPQVVKTGALLNGAIVTAVVQFLSQQKYQKKLVVDPVIKSTTNTTLLNTTGLELVKKKLFPMAFLITPNILEAALLSGITITTLAQQKNAARALLKTGCHAVLIKGGHAKGPMAHDVLATNKELRVYTSPKTGAKGNLERIEKHGTGCSLAAAIATAVSLHIPLHDAVKKSRNYVTHMIQSQSPCEPEPTLLNHAVAITPYFMT